MSSQELVVRINKMVKAFPKQPEESDWEDLKNSLDNAQQKLAVKGEYIANNFYEAIMFVPYTEARLAYIADIERVIQDPGLSEEEKEEEIDDITLEYESYLAKALLYLGWTVGWCPQAGSFLLNEEVPENICRRCVICAEETPQIKWRTPTEIPPETG